MDISVDSLRAYEGGKRIPPDKVVIKMIEIYNTQYLAYQHLKTSAEVGRVYLPDIEFIDMPLATLNLQTRVDDYNQLEKTLVRIVSDGKISEDEKEDFERILKKLDGVIEAVYTFKFAKPKIE